MTNEPSLWNELAQAILAFEDGDVVAVSGWITLLDQAKKGADTALGGRIDEFAQWLRDSLLSGMPPGFQDEAGARLDDLQRVPSPPGDPLAEHGPAFVAEAQNRIARAQELILGLEQSRDPMALDELFRIAHTIKGEAGFLHLEALVDRTHTLENLLDGLRVGTRVWSPSTGDALLAGFDDIAALLPRLPTTAGEKSSDQREVLRIPAEKIDALVAMVGELLVAMESGKAESTSLIRKLGRGLQQGALRLRTEPLRGLFGRLRRGGRDLSRDLGKPIDFQVAGEDLELDRNLIANLEEPLLHLLRNALDHGIESEATRLQAGKPAVGLVSLRALRKGNQISIVLSDDGAGLNPERIWAKACQKGLASGPMPDRDAVLALVFRPGFSTADTLTAVSGRGVGMDVVATMARDNRGRVKLESEVGKGTSVVLTFPLSTAVMEGIVVRSGRQRYLVPIHSVEETLYLKPDAHGEVTSGNRIYSLRGAPLPVHLLEELLHPGRSVPGEVPSWGMVVAGAQGRSLVLVDEVESQREAVIRSLGPGFQHLKGIPAATILAGGGLALVLDLDRLTEEER